MTLPAPTDDLTIKKLFRYALESAIASGRFDLKTHQAGLDQIKKTLLGCTDQVEKAIQTPEPLLKVPFLGAEKQIIKHKNVQLQEFNACRAYLMGEKPDKPEGSSNLIPLKEIRRLIEAGDYKKAMDGLQSASGVAGIITTASETGHAKHQLLWPVSDKLEAARHKALAFKLYIDNSDVVEGSLLKQGLMSCPGARPGEGRTTYAGQIDIDLMPMDVKKIQSLLAEQPPLTAKEKEEFNTLSFALWKWPDKTLFQSAAYQDNVMNMRFKLAKWDNDRAKPIKDILKRDHELPKALHESMVAYLRSLPSHDQAATAREYENILDVISKAILRNAQDIGSASKTR